MPWVAATAVLAVALFVPGVLNDDDTFWHLAAGEWIIAHGSVPHTDPFSYTRAGVPWTAHEWLAEVLMAWAFHAAGWGGIVVLTGTAAAAAFFQMGRHLGRLLPGGAVLLLLLLTGACVGPGLLARPHILALPFLGAWVAGLFIARTARRAPSWWLLPVMCVWANLHGGYVIGLLLVLPLGMEALLEAPGQWRDVALRWGGFLLGGTGAALLTPHGLDGLLFPFKLIGMAELSGIDEWRPTNFGTLQPLEIVLMAGLYVSLTRGVRLPPVRLLILLGLLHMALAHTRHQLLIGMVVPLLLADTLRTGLGAGDAPSGRPPAGRRRWMTGGAVLTVGLVAARLAVPVPPGGGRPLPDAALAHVPPQLAAAPVFNEYSFGGYLIHANIKPFIDGRADLYGPEFLRGYDAAVLPDKAALDRVLGHYGVRWTLLPPGSPAVAVLDLMPQWCRLYADRVAVVHALSC